MLKEIQCKEFTAYVIPVCGGALVKKYLKFYSDLRKYFQIDGIRGILTFSA